MIYDWNGMAGYADCLARFVNALGLQNPHIAGLSFGGALALRHSEPEEGSSFLGFASASGVVPRPRFDGEQFRP